MNPLLILGTTNGVMFESIKECNDTQLQTRRNLIATFKHWLDELISIAGTNCGLCGMLKRNAPVQGRPARSTSRCLS